MLFNHLFWCFRQNLYWFSVIFTCRQNSPFLCHWSRWCCCWCCCWCWCWCWAVGCGLRARYITYYRFIFIFCLWIPLYFNFLFSTKMKDLYGQNRNNLKPSLISDITSLLCTAKDILATLNNFGLPKNYLK